MFDMRGTVRKHLRGGSMLVITIAAAVSGCTKQSDEKMPPAVAVIEGQALPPLVFVLRVDEPVQKWSHYLSVRLQGDDLQVRQANVLTLDNKAVDSRTFAAATCKKELRHLDLERDETLLLTAAFTELDFRKPNLVHFSGAVTAADSVSEISEERKTNLAGAELAEPGRLHVYAFLESNKRGYLFDVTLDRNTGEPPHVDFNDSVAFELINSFHLKKIPAPLARFNSYLELLDKL